MKTITSIFLFFLTTTLYSQNLNDSVKFDSLNKSLICDNLMDLVRETRLKNGSAEIEKDSAAILSSKYHTMYFEKYRDESTIHNKPIDFEFKNLGYIAQSIYDTPENRLFTIGLYTSKGEFNYSLTKEITKFYKINKNISMTYSQLVENIFIDFTSDSSVCYDFSNQKKFFGISYSVITTENEEVILSVTLVIGKRERISLVTE
jgi:hypothetical protein